MASEEAVSNAIGYLRGALGRSTLPQRETEKAWNDAFGDVSDSNLEQAVKWYAKDTTEKSWPLPVEILAEVRKVESWRFGQALEQGECRACGGLGLVRSVYAERSYWAGLPCMRPCSCAYGKSKALWLESGRKAGRVCTSDRPEKPPPDESAREKPKTTQEEIPF